MWFAAEINCAAFMKVSGSTTPAMPQSVIAARLPALLSVVAALEFFGVLSCGLGGGKRDRKILVAGDP